MARKLDRGAAAAAPLSLAYRDDLAASLVRVMTVWTSAPYQRAFARGAGIPDDDNAIPALFSLATQGPRRPSVLAAELHISPPAGSRLFDRLAAVGLSVRVADAGDSRASIVTLTDHGRAVAQQLFEAGDALMADLLADWPAADRQRLAHLMHRFADAVASDASTRTAPPDN